MNHREDRKAENRDQAPEEIRVTDRRRIHLHNKENGATVKSAEEPNLKPTYVEELEGRLKAAEQKLFEVQARFEQMREKMQRETDETRQRLNRAADERAQRAKIDFIAALLPVLDNLQRAIDAESSSSVESLLDGVKTTAVSFEAALAAAGVEPVTAVGQPFNPETHEAVDTVPVAANQDGIVTAEYARGYKIGEQLLRPARVQVGAVAKNAGSTSG